MSVVCITCFQRGETLTMNPYFQHIFDGLSLSNMINSISTLKIEENKVPSANVCQECTNTILSFYNLVKRYKAGQSLFTDINKKEEVFFLEEKDYDNYIDCEAVSYKENSDHEDNQNPSHSPDWPENDQENSISKFPNYRDSSPKFQEEAKPRVFDEMGNEEISSVKYTCNECGDSFLFRVGFCSHMVQKHNIYIENHMYEKYSTQITIKIPPLTGDPVNFARKSYTKKNIKTLDSFQCQVCRESLETAEDLKEHYNRHKNHICEHCGAAFVKNSYLRDHLLVHTSEKRYPCDICGKKFKYRNGLSVHRNIHVNFRGFMCDTCGQGFNAKSTLKTHIKLKHTNERNFPCPECDLTFKVKSWLDKHYTRKHTFNRTKDFVCNICGVAYLNKTTLTRHISEKHTGTPVRHYCTVCDKSYSMKTKLNMHMQKKHNIILNTTSQLLL